MGPVNDGVELSHLKRGAKKSTESARSANANSFQFVLAREAADKKDKPALNLCASKEECFREVSNLQNENKHAHLKGPVQLFQFF